MAGKRSLHSLAPKRRRPDLNSGEHRNKLKRVKGMIEMGIDVRCHICNGDFDLELPPGHPLGLTLNHLDRVCDGGDPKGKRLPAHRSCNSRYLSAKKTKPVWDDDLLARAEAENVIIPGLNAPSERGE